jgi:hypothetical protein
MYTVMKDIFADKNRQEAIFLSGEGQDLEYTIVRPGGLGIGAPTGIINVIEGKTIIIMIKIIEKIIIIEKLLRTSRIHYAQRRGFFLPRSGE